MNIPRAPSRVQRFAQLLCSALHCRHPLSKRFTAGAASRGEFAAGIRQVSVLINPRSAVRVSVEITSSQEVMPSLTCV